MPQIFTIVSDLLLCIRLLLLVIITWIKYFCCNVFGSPYFLWWIDQKDIVCLMSQSGLLYAL